MHPDSFQASLFDIGLYDVPFDKAPTFRLHHKPQMGFPLAASPIDRRPAKARWTDSQRIRHKWSFPLDDVKHNHHVKENQLPSGRFYINPAIKYQKLSFRRRPESPPGMTGLCYKIPASAGMTAFGLFSRRIHHDLLGYCFHSGICDWKRRSHIITVVRLRLFFPGLLHLSCRRSSTRPTETSPLTTGQPAIRCLSGAVFLDFRSIFSLTKKVIEDPVSGCGPVAAVHLRCVSTDEPTLLADATRLSRGDCDHAEWYREVVQ
jgi:hypothetical protein